MTGGWKRERLVSYRISIVVFWLVFPLLYSIEHDVPTRHVSELTRTNALLSTVSHPKRKTPSQLHRCIFPWWTGLNSFLKSDSFAVISSRRLQRPIISLSVSSRLTWANGNAAIRSGELALASVLNHGHRKLAAVVSASPDAPSAVWRTITHTDAHPPRPYISPEEKSRAWAVISLKSIQSCLITLQSQSHKWSSLYAGDNKCWAGK